MPSQLRIGFIDSSVGTEYRQIWLRTTCLKKGLYLRKWRLLDFGPDECKDDEVR